MQESDEFSPGRILAKSLPENDVLITCIPARTYVLIQAAGKFIKFKQDFAHY